jgi:hypothetical protein
MNTLVIFSIILAKKKNKTTVSTLNNWIIANVHKSLYIYTDR